MQDLTQNLITLNGKAVFESQIPKVLTHYERIKNKYPDFLLSYSPNPKYKEETESLINNFILTETLKTKTIIKHLKI